MKTLLLLAHPKKGSFNHAIAQRAASFLNKREHSVFYHDLYDEKFDPLLQAEELADDFEPEGLLKTHCEQLQSADLVIVIHPNWRDQPPAILKGWVDRVIRAGVAFSFEGEPGEKGVSKPLLTGKSAVVFNTSDCSEKDEIKLGDPLETFWKEHIFASSGIEKFERRNFCGVFLSTEDQRVRWLEEVEDIVERNC